MSLSLLLVLMTAASYRLARLIAVDSILARPRAALRGLLAEGISCMWCVGTWTSALIVWRVDAAVGLPLPVLVWGAVSASVGLIAENLDAGA